MQVITLGYPDDATVALRGALAGPHRVDQSTGEVNQPFVIDEDGPVAAVPTVNVANSSVAPNPVLPTAQFVVRAAPPDLQQAFADRVAGFGAPPWDANDFEDWLAQELRDRGFELPDLTPSLVLLNAEASHFWRIRYPTGTLTPVRVFSERQPLLVVDPSAAEDPAVGSGGYNSPLKPSATDLIATMVRDAVEFRLLQGAVYPESTASCHAITSIAAVRVTSLETAGVLQSIEQGLDPISLEAAFDGITDGLAFHDLKVLRLPLDDPALDTVSRGDHMSIDAVRSFITLHWEQYHVDHPGCEEYLNIVFVTDLASTPAYSGVIPSGMAMYDSTPGRRLALTWEHDLVRLQDAGGPASACGESCDREYNYVNLLLVHETGHLVGLPHPHNYFRNDSSLAVNHTFTSIWSSMSYSQLDRLIGFGAVDRANWLRNRAGFALLEAEARGLKDSSDWNAAMDAAGRYDWTGVWTALRR